MFRELAERMAPDFPFYGLQAYGLDGTKPYLKTVEEMAIVYFGRNQAVPTGWALLLRGFCNGRTDCLPHGTDPSTNAVRRSRCWP